MPQQALQDQLSDNSVKSKVVVLWVVLVVMLKLNILKKLDLMELSIIKLKI